MELNEVINSVICAIEDIAAKGWGEIVVKVSSNGCRISVTKSEKDMHEITEHN